jgi:hypothetical protein
MDYYNKYLKYKSKYFQLIQEAGALGNISNSNIPLYENLNKREPLPIPITDERFFPNDSNFLLNLTPDKIKYCTNKNMSNTSFILPDLELTGIVESDFIDFKKLEFMTPNTNFIKQIGRGSFGTVFSIKHNDILYSIKLPNDKTIPLDEISIYKKLINTTCKNFINFKIVPINLNDSDIVFGVLMPKASGNLNDILDIFKNNEDLCMKVIKIIGNILLCFLKNDYIYFDIKPNNILFVCKDNKIYLFLGDLGSFVDIKTHEKSIVPTTYLFIIATLDWPNVNLLDNQLVTRILTYLLILLYLNLYDYEKYKKFFQSNTIYIFNFFNNFNSKIKESDYTFDQFFYKLYENLSGSNLTSSNAADLFLNSFEPLDLFLEKFRLG